jgi:hypothetical protein
MFNFNSRKNFNTIKNNFNIIKNNLPIARHPIESFNSIQNNYDVEPADIDSPSLSSLSGDYVKPYTIPMKTVPSINTLFENKKSECNVSIIFARIILIILIIVILYFTFIKNSTYIKNISFVADYTDDY